MADVRPSSPVVTEGFLCPLCKKDFGSKGLLEQHFEEHTREDDKDVLQHIKGIFGKAKKFFNISEDDGDSQNPFSTQSSNQIEHTRRDTLGSSYQEEVQELGQTRSMFDTYKVLRTAKVSHCNTEGNKLLIRLEKLCDPAAPADANKRREFERRVVPWIADDTVKSCHGCSHSFGMFRRKHHCRLCGGIVCEDCSYFVPFEFAIKFAKNDRNAIKDGEDAIFSSRDVEGSKAQKGMLRICVTCAEILRQKMRRIQMRHDKPVIVSYYEKLRLAMTQIDAQIPEYENMADSLRNGEVTYSLCQAQERRDTVLKHFNILDSVSKQILKLESTDSQSTSTEMALKKAVRSSVAVYLQTHMLSLQNLPSEQQLRTLQIQREKERNAKIQRELQQQALREANKPTLSVTKRANPQQAPAAKKSPQQVKPAETSTSTPEKGSAAGWKPSERMGPVVEDRDPMVQQMTNIKEYIKQARQAEKWDELVMLEDNLQTLQEVYWQEQKQKTKQGGQEE